MNYYYSEGPAGIAFIKPPIQSTTLLEACKEAADTVVRAPRNFSDQKTQINFGIGHSHESVFTALSGVMTEYGHVLLKASNVQRIETNFSNQ